MTREFETIEAVAENLKNKLNAEEVKKVCMLFAFNSVGKTRITKEFTVLNVRNEETGKMMPKTLCYSAFLEDLFHWDNENNILHIDTSSWEFELIRDEGWDGRIADNFKEFLNTKTEPEIDLSSGGTVFKIITGGDVLEHIKISRGEESIFMWSVFYTFLDVAINELARTPETREIHIFDDLEYIVIDDPVSSIDDYRIISLAIKIAELIKKNPKREAEEKKRQELEQQGNFPPAYINASVAKVANVYRDIDLKYFITTHHPLFFNVLFNSTKRRRRNFAYILEEKDSQFYLKKQGNDSPFAYHLLVKGKIIEAIDNDTLEKYHFNLFRTLLEKTANFLGFNNWSECILNEENKVEVVRLINHYSHAKLSELESSSMSNTEKELFISAFNAFIEDFKFQ